MTKTVHPTTLVALLSFNGGFVDTAGFLGLHGLFTAHVTGNFVTLAAALLEGSHGIIGKLIALPEFILVVAIARLGGTALRGAGAPVLPLMLSAKVALLVSFFALAVAFGPFPDPDSPAALLTGFAGIAAMAMQNAVHRVHLSDLPPTTLMTGSTTQATLDAIDLALGATVDTSSVKGRLGRLSFSILCFAGGCAASALLYWLIGFWCLAVPVLVGALTALLTVKTAPAQ